MKASILKLFVQMESTGNECVPTNWLIVYIKLLMWQNFYFIRIESLLFGNAVKVLS